MKTLKESWNYVKASKNYTFLAIAIFFLFSIVGFVFPVFQEKIYEMILELKLLFEGLNLWQTIGLIFFNNANLNTGIHPAE